MPRVSPSIRRRNLARGKENAECLCAGSRCLEMAKERPLSNDAVVCLVVATRYNRCRGNMIAKDECTR